MSALSDKATLDYAAAVDARKQAENLVVASSQALNDAKAQVDKLIIAEDIALFNLGMTVGMPADKILVSASAKEEIKATTIASVPVPGISG